MTKFIETEWQCPCGEWLPDHYFCHFHYDQLTTEQKAQRWSPPGYVRRGTERVRFA